MIVFHTDLDNTLIYSYKQDIGEEKINIERYQGREISFMTKKTYALLSCVREKMLVVPTTTRTEEQYKRIDLGLGTWKYALVCNGGILLTEGKRDEAWYRDSLAMIEPFRDEMEEAEVILKEDSRRSFDLRVIDDLFVFTKCREAEDVAGDLRRKFSGGSLAFFSYGEKVYAVPSVLNKGTALLRFREYLRPAYVMAAGDSEFDVPMVEKADWGMMPEDVKDSRLFAEAVLEECLRISRNISER